MSYKGYCLRACAAVLLLASASAAQTQPARDKGPDYSALGGEYGVLNNLLMYGVNKVEYVGTQRVQDYGVNYTAARFLVRAEVFVSAEGTNRCADEGRCSVKALAEFHVLVGLDEGGKIHDRMLQSIHDYWSANKPVRWKKADADEHVNYRDGRYIMFQALRGPYGGGRVKRLVWVDGKVVKFEFRRFLRETPYYAGGFIRGYSELEALEAFAGSNIRLRVDGVEIRAQQMKGSFREEFFKLYNGGAFRGAS
jgi:hypothetical protein